MARIEQAFSSRILDWYDRNKRELPWRETRDPYRIWLSEIILQQTRVAQGLPYYLNFVDTFPTVDALANATQEEVLRVWEGLGYYSRARNLHECAKTVHLEFHGSFPSTYEGLLKLKGIGPYTAAAIASIAFDEKVPALDGNVYRLVARVFGIYADIADSGNRKVFIQKLESLISPNRPGDFNQAMMEFGALQCTPVKPDCASCIFSDGCFAYARNEVPVLPVKVNKTKVRHRYMNYLVFAFGNKILFRQRAGKDIWQGLFDFYSIEKTTQCSDDDILGEIEIVVGGAQWEVLDISSEFKHQLTHQLIHAKFYLIGFLDEKQLDLFSKKNELLVANSTKWADIPKPILIKNYLKSKDILFSSSKIN